MAQMLDPDKDKPTVRSFDILRGRTAYQLFLMFKMEEIDVEPAADGRDFDATLTKLQKR